MRLFGEEPQPSRDDWYTPPPVVAAARAVMGGIDLDPASCETANRVVRADVFWSEVDWPLTRRWFGRVWLNPPFGGGLMRRFVDYLHGQLDHVDAALVVQPCNTSAASWRSLRRADAVCWLPHEDWVDGWWGPAADATDRAGPWGFQPLMVAGFKVDRRLFRQEFGSIGPVR